MKSKTLPRFILEKVVDKYLIWDSVDHQFIGDTYTDKSEAEQKLKTLNK